MKPSIAKSEPLHDKKGKPPVKDYGYPVIKGASDAVDVVPDMQPPMDSSQSVSQGHTKDVNVTKGTQSSKETDNSVNKGGTDNLDASQEKKTAPVVANLPELIPEPSREASSSSNQDWRGSRRPRPPSPHDWKNWSSWNDWEK